MSYVIFGMLRVRHMLSFICHMSSVFIVLSGLICSLIYYHLFIWHMSYVLSLSSFIFHLSYVMFHMSSLIHLFSIFHLSSLVRLPVLRLSFVCPPSFICHLSPVHLSSFIFHVSYVICRMSSLLLSCPQSLICHLSSFMCHLWLIRWSALLPLLFVLCTLSMSECYICTCFLLTGGGRDQSSLAATRAEITWKRREFSCILAI